MSVEISIYLMLVFLRSFISEKFEKKIFTVDELKVHHKKRAKEKIKQEKIDLKRAEKNAIRSAKIRKDKIRDELDTILLCLKASKDLKLRFDPFYKESFEEVKKLLEPKGWSVVYIEGSIFIEPSKIETVDPIQTYRKS